MSECYLKGHCMSETGACQGEPDEGCPVYRYFLDLIQKEADPRIMTLDEVHAMKPGDSTWLEWRILHEDGTIAKGCEHWVLADDGNVYGPDSYTWLSKVTEADDHDFQERHWTAKPTEEQRESTPWPEWKKEEWHG